MTEIPFERTETSMRPGFGQAVLYRLLVTLVFILAAFVVIAGRIGGARRSGGVWQEAREAAYAVAGYAFKY